MQFENDSELEIINKLGKEVLVRMVLDYRVRFDTTVTNINKELTDLRNKFSKLKSDVSISKNINNKLSSQLTKFKKKL